MTPQQLHTAFPRLSEDGWRQTSPADVRYNCIAWAAGDELRFWWPLGGYWPDGVPRKLEVSAFVDAYATVGYTPCHDGSFDIGAEKVAIYCASNGEPTHAARQLDTGLWTSKLGRHWDIEHTTPVGVEGPVYGAATHYLSRPVSDSNRYRARTLYLLLLAGLA